MNPIENREANSQKAFCQSLLRKTELAARQTAPHRYPSSEWEQLIAQIPKVPPRETTPFEKSV